MKFFIIVSALFALAASATVNMTLQQIDSALQNPNLDPSLKPALEAALNQIMAAIMNGETLETVAVELPLDIDNGIMKPEPAPVPIEVPVGNSPAGPLVQVLVNVNSGPAADDSPVEVAYNPDNSPLNPVDVILN